MKAAPSSAHELQQLQKLTEQCMELVLIARQQAAKYTEYYVASAEEFRRQADRTRFPEIRAMLLRIAELHRRLVRHGEQTEGVPETSCDAAVDREQLMHDAESPKTATEQGKKAVKHDLDEDAVAQARRHVAEGESHIARQEALLAKLSRDDRHAALAAEAREILTTLRHTLDLARDHLALELRK